jgi:hypothetical protein
LHHRCRHRVDIDIIEQHSCGIGGRVRNPGDEMYERRPIELARRLVLFQRVPLDLGGCHAHPRPAHGWQTPERARMGFRFGDDARRQPRSVTLAMPVGKTRVAIDDEMTEQHEDRKQLAIRRSSRQASISSSMSRGRARHPTTRPIARLRVIRTLDERGPMRRAS